MFGKSDTKQAQQKLRSNLAQHKYCKVKRHMTKQKSTKQINTWWNSRQHRKLSFFAWWGLGEVSEPEFLHMTRPKRGRTRPTISLESDCDLESEAGRALGNYKTFKRVPWGLASISTEIISG